MTRARWIAGLLPLAAMFDSPRAEACSPPGSYIQSRAVLPADGSVDVPTNTRILIEYDASEWSRDPELELRVAGGGTVAVEVTTAWSRRWEGFLLTPTSPLAPATTYEVLDPTIVPCEQPNTTPDPCTGAPAIVASFTTGSGPDVEPPVIAGVTVESVYIDEGPDSTCDWSGAYVVHQVANGGVGDDRPADQVRFLYYDDLGVQVAGPVRWSSAGHDCSGPYAPTYDVWVQTDTFAIRAVDLAGNVETTPHVVYGQSCADLEPDPVEPDAGLTDAGDDSGADEGGGCSTGDPSLVAGLLALVLLAFSRSVRRASR